MLHSLQKPDSFLQALHISHHSEKLSLHFSHFFYNPCISCNVCTLYCKDWIWDYLQENLKNHSYVSLTLSINLKEQLLKKNSPLDFSFSIIFLREKGLFHQLMKSYTPQFLVIFSDYHIQKSCELILGYSYVLCIAVYVINEQHLLIFQCVMTMIFNFNKIFNFVIKFFDRITNYCCITFSFFIIRHCFHIVSENNFKIVFKISSIFSRKTSNHQKHLLQYRKNVYFHAQYLLNNK